MLQGVAASRKYLQIFTGTEKKCEVIGKRRETIPVLTCLGVLRVPALHMGSQEDIAQEGFVTEVALGRGRESPEPPGRGSSDLQE